MPLSPETNDKPNANEKIVLQIDAELEEIADNLNYRQFDDKKKQCTIQ